jgi:hypothetical protein
VKGKHAVGAHTKAPQGSSPLRGFCILQT